MPKGIPCGYKLTRAFAREFCDTVGASCDSLPEIIRQNPSWPSWDKLRDWRGKTPWFAEMWRKAREDQGEHLAQKCLDLARQANPKNAHAIRVKYDIYKWVASRFAPAVYGDRPVAPTTNIAIGFSLSPERLNEIRSKLDVTRDLLSQNNTRNTNAKRIQNGNDANNGKVEPLPLTNTSRECPP